jgi:iron-sulfur cluster assembly protein
MISLTDAAVKKIQQTIKRRGSGVGIRVGVKTTGCSGLAYVLEYVDRPTELDPKSCPYLQGTTIDYVRRGLNEGFEFSNPNERDKCGCGESFRV